MNDEQLRGECEPPAYGPARESNAPSLPPPPAAQRLRRIQTAFSDSSALGSKLKPLAMGADSPGLDPLKHDALYLEDGHHRAAV